MAIEVNSEMKAICHRCGMQFGRRKGNFSVSYQSLHKGVGNLPVCKSCVEDMYNTYMAQFNNDAKTVVRIMCRKLDIFWNETIFDRVVLKATNRTVMTHYLATLSTSSYAGKSYDDTLIAEGMLGVFGERPAEIKSEPDDTTQEDDEAIDIPKELIAFWGDGYDLKMYEVLETKYAYYYQSLEKDVSKIDLGTERLLRQLCILEATIDRDNAAGKSVEKSVNTYNTLIGSLNLKPTQKKDENDANDNTPFGVWIKRWENQRPIPDPDPEFEDVDGIVKYISVWFLGHLCKMLGIKNTYCKLYEDELEKMRIDRPEYEDEDDETMFNDIFGSDEDSDG